MKFPGQRKSKHYFPVDRRDPLVPQNPLLTELGKAYVVGIDQTLVDIEAHVDEDFLTRYGLSKGTPSSSTTTWQNAFMTSSRPTTWW